MFDVNFQTAQLYLSGLHVAVMFCMSRATNRNVNVLENFQIRLHLVIFKNHLLGWKYTRVNLDGLLEFELKDWGGFSDRVIETQTSVELTHSAELKLC